jgi:hypothetical protein
MKRRIVWALGLTVLHAAVTMGLLLTMLGLSGAAFDGKRSSGAIDAIGGGAMQVLMFPVVTLYSHALPRETRMSLSGAGYENVAFYLNSLVWGATLVFAFSRRRRAV